MTTGRPLPIETQDYVALLMPMIDGGRPESRSTAPFDLVAWLRSALFAPHENTALVAVHAPASASSDRPPIERRVVDLSALAPRSDPFCSPRLPDSIPMSQIALRRALSPSLPRLARRQSRMGGSDHGLQDKSAGRGPAHAIGQIGVLPHFCGFRNWRFTATIKRIQFSKRHPRSKSAER